MLLCRIFLSANLSTQAASGKHKRPKFIPPRKSAPKSLGNNNYLNTYVVFVFVSFETN